MLSTSEDPIVRLTSPFENFRFTRMRCPGRSLPHNSDKLLTLSSAEHAPNPKLMPSRRHDFPDPLGPVITENPGLIITVALFIALKFSIST